MKPDHMSFGVNGKLERLLDRVSDDEDGLEGKT